MHGPLPFKVIKWAKIPEDSILEGVREYLDGNTIIQDHLDVPTNGDAFDLMVYTIDWHERKYEWNGAWPYDYVEGSEESIARWFRAVARCVKPLPPKQEGGVQV